MKVLSFDAETNGLWGKVFALSAVVYEDDVYSNHYIAYLGEEAISDGWVRNNILPRLKGVKQTHSSYEEMLKDFAAFYKGEKEGANIIVHMGVPVESNLLREMHEMGLIGDWDAPYPLIDLAGMLQMAGENPVSVDEYNTKYDLLKDVAEIGGMSAHHPLYDSIATVKAYYHLIAHQ